MIPKSDAQYLRYLANKMVAFGNVFNIYSKPHADRLREIAEDVERYENRIKRQARKYEKIINQQAHEIGVLMKANMSDKEIDV